MQVERGIALVDIVRELQPLMLRLSLPAALCADLHASLADAEFRLAYSTNESLQLAALVGSFVAAREQIVAAAQ